MPLQTIDLASKLSQFSGHFAPRTVALFNGHDVMVAKILGEFSWHSHADTDDFFLVLKGRLFLDLPDGVTLQLEPTGTPNSGDAATAAPRRVL